VASAGTNAVWNSWVTVDSTSTTAGNGNVWVVWCSATSGSVTATSSSASTENIWYQWNDRYVYRVDGNSVSYQAKPAPETEEQKQARLQREEQARLEVEARRKAEREAKERAERLLVSQLNSAQLQQLKEMDAFIVQLETRRYKVRRNHRVQELDNKDKPIAEYCIVPNQNDWFLPPADVMLAKKLLLEHDEAAFLRIANRTPMVQ
jgi:hypothetical protein